MQLLFICHRPYHVLRSAQIISLLRENKIACKNVMIGFNVYSYAGGNIGTNKVIYNDYDHIFNYTNYFDEVVQFDRKDEVSISDYKNFKKYYTTSILVFDKTLARFGAIDYVFFFSDKEKPVEMLVSICKKKFNSKAILIDEGIASYITLSNFKENVLKKMVIYFGGFRLLSKSSHYGGSGLYDFGLSNFPNHSFLKTRTFKIPLLVKEKIFDLFNPLAMSQLQLTNKKCILYISGGTSLQAVKDLGRYYLPLEEELAVLKKMSQWAQINQYSLVIKEHPILSKGMYDNIKGATIIKEAMMPAELFFSSSCVVISTTSSVLLNAKASDILAISIINFCGINQNKSIAVLKKMGVHLPISIDELLRSIVENDRISIKKNSENLDFIELFTSAKEII